MNKSKLFVFGLLVLLLAPLSVAFGEYGPQPVNVTIGSNGEFTYTNSFASSGISASFDIQGTPGATGTFFAELDDGNPQPSATVPAGTSLTTFITVSFNMNANDFSDAKVTISYTDADVSSITPPFAIYKYIADNNQYVELPSVVDTTAKTITVILTSPTDPILAIGGTSGSPSPTPIILWAAIVVVAIAIVLVALLLVRRLRPEILHLGHAE